MEGSVKQGGSSSSPQRRRQGKVGVCAWVILIAWVGGSFLFATLSGDQAGQNAWLSKYQAVFLGLSGLVVGLVVIWGVLPDTRFGPPKVMGELESEDTVRLAVKAGQGTLELRSRLGAVPSLPITVGQRKGNKP